MEQGSGFTAQSKTKVVWMFVAFCAVLMMVMAAMAIKNYKDSQNILTESVEERMLAIAVAARELIDGELFVSLNSAEDVESSSQALHTLSGLKSMANEVGAKYIYALKKIGDEYYFVFDTDSEIEGYFDSYTPGEVHLKAFQGINAAQAINMDDRWGSFATAAVPLYHNGILVGIVSADIEDGFIERNKDAQYRNVIILISLVGVMLVSMTVLLSVLLDRIRKMQAILFRQANYDKLTRLPNRQYLMDYLEVMTKDRSTGIFYLYFIDLDNFKSVNDTAGHDAGDALLQDIASFLISSQVSEGTKAFRPTAGALNVAARIGGDEFIIVSSAPANDEAACEYAAQLIEGLQTRVKNESIKRFNVGLSIGIAKYPDHSANFHVLLKYADIAMYHAKKENKNAFRMYEVDMKAKEEK